MQFDGCVPTVADRVVQTAAKLVLEPIFEADFHGQARMATGPGAARIDAVERSAPAIYAGG